jgi:hypothetical protein
MPYNFTPPDPNAYSGQINDSDTIAFSIGPNYLNDTAYIEQGDTLTSIMQPGWNSAQVGGINDSGLVVGTYYTPSYGSGISAQQVPGCEHP